MPFIIPKLLNVLMRQIGLMRQLIFDDALVPDDGLHTHATHTISTVMSFQSRHTLAHNITYGT